MNAGDLVLGCIADSYFKYLRTLGGLFTPPEYIELSGRTYTLGRSLGSGGAADVLVATACSSLGGDSTPEQYALKKVREGGRLVLRVVACRCAQLAALVHSAHRRAAMSSRVHGQSSVTAVR